MRCETCQRPILRPETKRHVWNWSVVVAVFFAVFFSAAIVETIANFDVIGMLAVAAGYGAGIGIMFLWWHIAAKDY